MSRIATIQAVEVLDCRGNPTVGVEVRCQGGAWGRAIVPSGASTGHAEALELRDGDLNRYEGRGVLQAVRNVNEVLAPALIGFDPAGQQAIDDRLCELDGTANKSRLGANAILGVSLAAAHVAAARQQMPLYRWINQLWQTHVASGKPLPAGADLVDCRVPMPMTNIISGGLHGGGNIEFQDFLIVPVGAASFHQALEWLVRVHRCVGPLLAEKGYESRPFGDEGGFAPRVQSNRDAAAVLVRAIYAAGFEPPRDAMLAVDVASTHFHEEGRYVLKKSGGVRLSTDDMIKNLVHLAEGFSLFSIEDGLAEEDWQGWRELTRCLGDDVWLIGDDLFATNPERLKKGIEMGAANSVLIKFNQIGTLSETLHTMRIAREAGYHLIVSARSGETEDDTIADLAVGTAAEMIKIGSVLRSERLAKYNRLLRIEDELGPAAIDWRQFRELALRQC